MNGWERSKFGVKNKQVKLALSFYINISPFLSSSLFCETCNSSLYFYFNACYWVCWGLPPKILLFFLSNWCHNWIWEIRELISVSTLDVCKLNEASYPQICLFLVLCLFSMSTHWCWKVSLGLGFLLVCKCLSIWWFPINVQYLVPLMKHPLRAIMSRGNSCVCGWSDEVPAVPCWALAMPVAL